MRLPYGYSLAAISFTPAIVEQRAAYECGDVADYLDNPEHLASERDDYLADGLALSLEIKLHAPGGYYLLSLIRS